MSTIFVFGSNRAGIHGAGAAKFARDHHGAIRGCGEGRQGYSYGIPTKDEHLHTLPLGEIKKHVEKFLDYAVDHPELLFQVTRVGCGLAGYTDQDISPMFKGAPSNCNLPDGWEG